MGLTPLYLASQASHEDMARFLVLEARADVNLRNRTGHSALHEAIAGGFVRIAAFLMDNGADKQAVDAMGVSVWHEATGNGAVELLELLLEYEVSMHPLGVEQIDKVMARHPFHYAAVEGREEFVRAILDKQLVDVDLADADGCTAVYYAAANGHAWVLEVLLEHGGDPNLASLRRSPLHCAVEWRRLDCVRLLVRHGAALDVRDKDGITPREAVERKGFADVVEVVTTKMTLSYERFLAEGELLVRASHDLARREELGKGERQAATWTWRRGPRPHLDGSAYLVSMGNVRRVWIEERQVIDSEVAEDDESLELLDEDDDCVAVLPEPLEATEAVLLELHIVFHATYRTPALYFRGASVDGTPVSPERVLRGVHFAGRGYHMPVVASVELHPVLGTPFALLHPCETAGAMALLLEKAAGVETGSSATPSSNSSGDSRKVSTTYLASWMSLVQPLTGIAPTDYV